MACIKRVCLGLEPVIVTFIVTFVGTWVDRIPKGHQNIEIRAIAFKLGNNITSLDTLLFGRRTAPGIHQQRWGGSMSYTTYEPPEEDRRKEGTVTLLDPKLLPELVHVIYIIGME